MKKMLVNIKRGQQLLLPILAFIALTLNAQPSNEDSANDENIVETAGSLESLAKHLQVEYQVVSNLQNEDCKAIFNGPCFEGELRFSLDDKQNFQDFTLLFSHIAPIKWDDHPQLDIEHFNGDLHKIDFSGSEFLAGDVTIAFKAAFWHANHSDVMPNYFVTSQSEGPYIVDSTRIIVDNHTGLQQAGQLVPHKNPQQYRRHQDDKLPLADTQWMFNHYQTWQTKSQMVADVNRIIPKIKNTEFSESASLDLSAGVHLQWQDGQASLAVSKLITDAGIALSNNGVPVVIKADPEGQKEGYKMVIGPAGIEVRAATKTGADYALVSLYQILKTQAKKIPLGTVEDAPRYEFRGVHVDLSRNFLGKDVILHLIEQMFLLKLNKLHLHLADDEGWRLDIPSIPELTQVGAWRCYEPAEDNCLLPQLGSGPFRDAPTNGFLTVADYEEILRLAHERHIEVIPSFDLPGHARAAVKAMEARYRKYKALENTEKAEQYLLSDFADDTRYSSVQFYNDNTVNPCMESTYRFIDHVIGAVKNMHADAQVPLTTYHIGADETAGAWVNSPVCKQLISRQKSLKDVGDLKPMFLNRVIEIIEAHGLKAAGWSDGMHKIINSEAGQGHQVNVWDTLFWDGHNIAQEFTEKGWSTVLSHPDVLYFDFPYTNHPQEHGYYWASKNTDEFKIFQFMPENQGANALQWQDRFGQPYTAQVNIADSFSYKGMQTQIWTESVRSVATFQYLMYPRLQVFAERVWHKAQWEIPLQDGNYQYAEDLGLMAQQLVDWQTFAPALLRYIQYDLIQGANFRVPPPGVFWEKGTLHVNSAWSQLDVECRAGTQPWVVVNAKTDVFAGAKQLVCRSKLDLVSGSKYSRAVTATINTEG